MLPFKNALRSLCLPVLLCINSVNAQDIEPRRWTPIPLDIDVIGVGYGRTSADIFFDPVMQVEDAELDMDIAGVSYVSSFELAERLVRFDLLVPWANGDWEGKLAGEDTTIKRVGLLDPRFRISINLLGTPAADAKTMRKYLTNKTSNTVVGAGLDVSVPWGEYDGNKLINLGENRYTIRPQLGIVHTRKSWSYELTGSIFFYTDNDDFYGKRTREQQPLYAIQSHLIRHFEQGRWASLSVGYGWGGQSKIDGVNKNDKHHTLLSALSFGMPINQTQSIKLGYLYGQTNSDTGLDIDSLFFAWSLLF